jgi:hypothetical protein
VSEVSIITLSTNACFSIQKKKIPSLKRMVTQIALDYLNPQRNLASWVATSAITFYEKKITTNGPSKVK